MVTVDRYRTRDWQKLAPMKKTELVVLSSELGRTARPTPWISRCQWDNVNDDAKKNRQCIKFEVIKVGNRFQGADIKGYVPHDTRFHWICYAPSPVEMAQARFLSYWRLGQMLTTNSGRSNCKWSNFKSESQSRSGPLKTFRLEVWCTVVIHVTLWMNRKGRIPGSWRSF